MKIGIVGVGKSLNVGDQLIAKCLGANILNISKEYAVSYYDLYEGEFDVEFSQPEIGLDAHQENREKKRTYYIPRFMKLFIADVISARRSNAMIKKFIEDKDVIIIGGGHLLIDNYGGFAIKIRRVLSACKAKKKRVFFWAVGVGKLGWVWRFLLAKKIQHIPIFTRDNMSKEALSLIVDRPDISTVIDPAFFSDLIVKMKDGCIVSEKREKKTIALFIMDPYEMVRHSDEFFSREFVASWWIDLINLLKPRYKIIVANNGSPNDFFYIERYIKANVHDVAFKSRALNYEAIINNVNQADYVIAQRLHAIIPSIALGKAVLALKWDSKVENILRDIGLEQCMIAYNHAPSGVVGKVSECEHMVNNTVLQQMKSHHISLLKRALKK